MDSESREFLGRQLIKLGDMMGDGLHNEPGGKWISREYRKVATALGYIPKKKRVNHSGAIDERMKQRAADVRCDKCQGELKQTRSGSKRARCADCGGLWQLLK